MPGKRFTLKLVAGLGAAAILGAACGGAGDTASDRNPGGTGQSQTTSAATLDKGAAALDQTLTDLLDGHVYLASITVVQGLENGLDSLQFKAAAQTLDQNSQDLAAAIESVYGAEAGEQFLTQWRQHIEFFVQYTEGKATKNDAMAQEALSKLQNYKKDFSAFLAKATGGRLPANGAAEALQMHVDSLVEAIDAAIAGDAEVFNLVYAAATDHMSMTASALAGAISGQFPDKFGGDVNSSGSDLQQGLTDLLDGHVYLAAIAITQGLGKGLDSPQFKAAATTLDQNSQDLAAAIESVYGAKAGEQFLSQWRAHIQFFVQYTQGKATKNNAMAQKALSRLQNYKRDFSAFLSQATGGRLAAGGAADALQMHVDSLIEAIDAAIAGDAEVFDLVYAAATDHMPMTASALAGAISGQFPDKFSA
jgi:hypothetical protein